MLRVDSLMLEKNSLIPASEAIAPEHPLAENLNLPLPDPLASQSQEIRSLQRRDRIPGIVKRLIPFDSDTSWEYWWTVPGRILLPEDVEIVKRDRSRVEAILAKLVWILGGYCFAEESKRHGEMTPLYDWQQVLAFAKRQGFESYLLDIDFLPYAIKPYKSPGDRKSSNSLCEYIAVEPAHWHIEFFQLQPCLGGFEIQEPKQLCSCQIWMGKPFMKHCKTGEISTQYDLWVSKPLDITTPPWRHSLE